MNPNKLAGIIIGGQTRTTKFNEEGAISCKRYCHAGYVEYVYLAQHHRALV